MTAPFHTTTLGSHRSFAAVSSFSTRRLLLTSPLTTSTLPDTEAETESDLPTMDLSGYSNRDNLPDVTYGVRIEHHGQHGPDCFACKLTTIHFGTHITSPVLHNAKDRWANDPVKNRIEELQGISIDTDQMNKNLHDGLKE